MRLKCSIIYPELIQCPMIETVLYIRFVLCTVYRYVIKTCQSHEIVTEWKRNITYSYENDEINYVNSKILQVSQYQSTVSLYANISGFIHRGIVTLSFCVGFVLRKLYSMHALLKRKIAVNIQELKIYQFCCS